MTVFVCEKCDARFVGDTVPPRGPICFKCHVKGITIGFTHGKETFHGPTFGEQARKQVEEAKANGLNPEPVGQRWV